MTDADRPQPVTHKRVVVRPSLQVEVQRGIEYSRAEDGRQTLDLYYPDSRPEPGRLPAVILVSGMSDLGALPFLGCRINEMMSFRDWATLIAESGLIAITYTTGADPAANARDVLRYLHAHEQMLGVDARKLALWSCSAHVPSAIGLLMDEPAAFAGIAMLYGFTLDLDGSTAVANAERTWRFANPARNRTIDNMPLDVPLFIARAGRDAIPSLNESLDRFVVHALRRNLPVTLVNHANGPHAFDLDDDSTASRSVVNQTLAFLRSIL